MSDSTTVGTAINHLPDEILIEILQLAIRSTHRLHPTRRLSAFSSVSRHWHSLCFNSPELWTDIRIIYNQLSGKVDLENWTRQWLERSHPRLVDIYLDMPMAQLAFNGDAKGFREVDTVTSMLTNYLDRIRSLTTSRRTNPYPTLEKLTGSLPSATHLEHLDLRLANEVGGVPSSRISMDKVLHAGVVLPNLRSQKLSHIDIVFPLEQLTSVDLHFLVPNEDSFRQMARMCPTLEYLTLRSLHPLENPLPLGAPPIHMPYLLFLSVTFHKGSKWGDSPQKAILSILSAPKLHYLRINGSPGTPHPRNVLPPLASFPSLHTLRLEHFEFVNPYSQNKSILIDPTYFRETSSVRHLQLVQTSLFSLNPVGRDERDNTGAGDLIRDLSTATAIPLPISLPSGPIPFPLLDTVTLYSSRSYGFNDVMWLCELVANRGPHASLSSSIKRVYLSKSSMRDCRRRSYQKDKSNSNNNSNSNSNSGNRESVLEGSTEDGHFTLEGWLRDRVEVYELDVENERDEDDA